MASGFCFNLVLEQTIIKTNQDNYHAKNKH